MKIKKFNEAKELPPEASDMKPTYSDKTLYVSHADLIKFIDENSKMGWNPICDLVRTFLNDEEPTYYDYKSINCSDEEFLKDYGENDLWVKRFFEVHNITDDVMFVFDD